MTCHVASKTKDLHYKKNLIELTHYHSIFIAPSVGGLIHPLMIIFFGVNFICLIKGKITKYLADPEFNRFSLIFHVRLINIIYTFHLQF